MVLHFLLFNLIWFALVSLGNTAIAIALVWLAFFIYQAKFVNAEFVVIGIVFLVGVSLDNTLTVLGLFQFTDSAYIPLWLVALWLCFSALLLRSPEFLRTSIKYQVLTAMIFAPLSYYLGKQLNAVSFGWPTIYILLLLAMIWPVIVVSALALQKKLLSGGN